MNKKVLLLGGSGLLGKNLQKKFRKTQLINPSHKDLDLRNISKTLKFLERKKPNSIIYLAGISKIDIAERNEDLAYELNYKVPYEISKFISKAKIPMIYISTDAIFDGYKRRYFFTEEDDPNPKSVYGKSKLLGEQSVLDNSNLNSSIRLINLFGMNQKSFVYKMIDALKKEKDFPGIIDQTKNPLYVGDASNGICFSLDQRLSGIYHLGAKDIITNYRFLVKIADKFKLDSKLIKKISFEEFMKDKIGYRKQNSVLLTKKFTEISKGQILHNVNKEIDSLYKNV